MTCPAPLLALLTLLAPVLLGPGAPAQPPARGAARPPFHEGTHVFRRILYDTCKQRLTPLRDPREVNDASAALVVILGDASPLAGMTFGPSHQTLRQFARWLIDNTDTDTVAAIRRHDIEDYKVWLAAQPGTKAPTMSKNTQRQRLRMIRICFERLIEWDWPDAPIRNPILHGDIPPRPEPLPKFLTDHDAAVLMAAARAHRLPRYRIVIEILARTAQDVKNA